MINRSFQDHRYSHFILEKDKPIVEDNHAVFKCDCGGKITIINETTIEHTCESIFAHHQDHSNTGIYERVQVNPKLTGGIIRYNWFRKWE